MVDYLNKDDEAALYKIINMGMEKGSESISELISQKVKLFTSELRILRFNEIQEHLDDLLPEMSVCVQQDFAGKFSGSGLMIFSTQGGINLIDILCDREEGTGDLSETDKLGLMEVGNILINACIGSIANVLGISFDFNLPKIDVKSTKSMYQGLTREDLSMVQNIIFIKTRFSVEEGEIEGYFNLVLESTSLDVLLKEIKKRQKEGI